MTLYSQNWKKEEEECRSRCITRKLKHIRTIETTDRPARPSLPNNNQVYIDGEGQYNTAHHLKGGGFICCCAFFDTSFFLRLFVLCCVYIEEEDLEIISINLSFRCARLFLSFKCLFKFSTHQRWMKTKKGKTALFVL